MRWLLALLCMLALGTAPLASPVEAAVPADHCAGMADGGADHGDKGAEAKPKSCCVTALATVDRDGQGGAPTLASVPPGAAPLVSLGGRRADVEIPPPRT